jgi:hypothetical protein
MDKVKNKEISIIIPSPKTFGEVTPFLVLKVVMMWVVTSCVLVGRYNISERHTVSIFRAEVLILRNFNRKTTPNSSSFGNRFCVSIKPKVGTQLIILMNSRSDSHLEILESNLGSGYDC